jgi:hypothetical protein
MCVSHLFVVRVRVSVALWQPLHLDGPSQPSLLLGSHAGTRAWVHVLRYWVWVLVG